MPTSTAEFPPSTSEPLIFPKIWFLLFTLHFRKFLPFIDPLAKMQKFFQIVNRCFAFLPKKIQWKTDIQLFKKVLSQGVYV